MKQLFIILFVYLLQPVAFTQDIETKLDELLSAYARQEKFNGTVLVGRKGKILLEKGYGLKDASLHALNDVNTIYQIGSVTKQFTAALILYLQEQKKLSVKDRISRFFPDFPNADKITIENLLTHTSGIYSYTNDEKFMASEITHSYNREKIMALFRDKPLEFEPGTKWSYSNSGYSMLGYIIEKVTNKPYEQLIRELIFRPLNMNHSGFDFMHLKSSDKAVGYLILNDEIKSVAPIVDSSISYAAGALFSTVEDLYKWERAMYNQKILKPESWKMAYNPFLNNYGYGLSIDTMFNRQIISHGGGIHGFNSHLFRIPQDEIAIILLNNKNNGSLQEITKSLAAILLDQKYEIPKAIAAVSLPDTLLKQYTGEYMLAPNVTMSISLVNGNLQEQLTGQQAYNIYAEKENTFFMKVVEARIVFFKDTEGKIDHLILYQNGREISAKKIK